MKILKLRAFVFALILSTSTGYAQYVGPSTRITLVSGNIASLKGVTNINIVYDYANLAVGTFSVEADYLKKKQEDYKKNPEKFEKFKQGWYNSRKERFEPKFEAMFNKIGAKIGMTAENGSTVSDITLKIHTMFIEPGYHIVISKMPAYVDMECVFLTKEGKEILRYFIKNSVGSQAFDADYDTGSRIVESYAKAAKMLMKDITKRLKKLKEQK